MSTQRSLSTLIDRAKSTLIAKTGQNNPAIDAIACAIAGVSYGQYGYQDQLFRELHPETCSEPWLYLHATRHDVERLLPTFATGFVRFFQTGGVVVIKKSTLVVDAIGNQFKTTKEQNSDEDISVIALKSGIESNLPNGSVLTLTEAVSGVDPSQVTCLGISGGAGVEDLEHWRKRVVTAFQKDELVGKADDYKAWAISAHSDVDYAWVLDNTPKLGMVEVYVGTRENNPTLTNEVLKLVQEEFEANRLAGCHPYALLPEQAIFNVEIQGIEDQVVRDDVIIALENLVKNKMGKINEVTKIPEPITPTEIVLAVSVITDSFILRSPVGEVIINNNQIHVLGDVIWTPPN